MENQRIRLSKSMLKGALLKLLKEKSLNQISIYEICQTAQINRTTFYKYYGSQTDLLQEIETDFFSQLNEDLKDIIDQAPNALGQVLDHLYEQREIFCILVQATPTREFTDQLFSIPSIGSLFQSLMDTENYSETQARYIRQFVFQGAFAVLCDWLSREDPEPASEIAEVMGQLKSRL
ncbi:MAG: TetR/AcrR family transcriptional regulator [Lachnospiraceae bacterium]|nr:TetR/AcrR family transcriptional regulator [Lachnospiraceae bacterium]